MVYLFNSFIYLCISLLVCCFLSCHKYIDDFEKFVYALSFLIKCFMYFFSFILFYLFFHSCIEFLLFHHLSLSPFHPSIHPSIHSFFLSVIPILFLSFYLYFTISHSSIYPFSIFLSYSNSLYILLPSSPSLSLSLLPNLTYHHNHHHISTRESA